VNNHKDTRHLGAEEEARAVIREAVDFLLGQEIARLENSVRFASAHARARELRRQLHLAGGLDR
jgi:hypothetical protein